MSKSFFSSVVFVFSFISHCLPQCKMVVDFDVGRPYFYLHDGLYIASSYLFKELPYKTTFNIDLPEKFMIYKTPESRDGEEVSACFVNRLLPDSFCASYDWCRCQFVSGKRLKVEGRTCADIINKLFLTDTSLDFYEAVNLDVCRYKPCEKSPWHKILTMKLARQKHFYKWATLYFFENLPSGEKIYRCAKIGFMARKSKRVVGGGVVPGVNFSAVLFNDVQDPTLQHQVRFSPPVSSKKLVSLFLSNDVLAKLAMNLNYIAFYLGYGLFSDLTSNNYHNFALRFLAKNKPDLSPELKSEIWSTSTLYVEKWRKTQINDGYCIVKDFQ